MEIKAEDLQGETLIKTCQDYVPWLVHLRSISIIESN